MTCYVENVLVSLWDEICFEEALFFLTEDRRPPAVWDLQMHRFELGPKKIKVSFSRASHGFSR